MKYLSLGLHALALIVCAGQMQPGFATGATLLVAATVTTAGWGLSRLLR